jgi:hypothetical protein
MPPGDDAFDQTEVTAVLLPAPTPDCGFIRRPCFGRALKSDFPWRCFLRQYPINLPAQAVMV